MPEPLAEPSHGLDEHAAGIDFSPTTEIPRLDRITHNRPQPDDAGTSTDDRP